MGLWKEKVVGDDLRDKQKMVYKERSRELTNRQPVTSICSFIIISLEPDDEASLNPVAVR